MVLRINTRLRVQTTITPLNVLLMNYVVIYAWFWESQTQQKEVKRKILGDPEVTASLYCNFAYLY